MPEQYTSAVAVATATAVDGSSAWDVSSVACLDGDDNVPNSVLLELDVSREPGSRQRSVARGHVPQQVDGDVAMATLREELEHKSKETERLRADVARLTRELVKLREERHGGDAERRLGEIRRSLRGGEGDVQERRHAAAQTDGVYVVEVPVVREKVVVQKEEVFKEVRFLSFLCLVCGRSTCM